MTARIKQEIKALTGLRGIAACLVMFYHFKLDNFVPAPLSTIIHHGYLSVDLFFVLSGFVMAMTYSHLFENGFHFSDYKKFLLRRVARVYPLYFVAVVAAILVFYFMPNSNDMDIDLTVPTIATNLLMIQSWGFSHSYLLPGWSISTEFAAYLLFPILLAGTYFSSRKVAFFWGFLAILTIITLALIPEDFIHFGKEGKIMNIWNEDTFGPLLRCLSEFTLGLLTFRLYGYAPARVWLQKKGVVMAIATLLALLFMIGQADVAIILLVPFFILALTSPTSLPAKFLAWGPIYGLGLISYSLYLCHLMTFWIKPSLLAYIEELYGQSHTYLYAALIQICLSLLLATITYLVIEKPGRTLLQKVFS